MTSQTKILLIGIDGLMLQRAIDSGRARTLAALRSNCYYSDMSVAMPTVSGPSWTTLLTGVTQQVHKVVNNEYTDHNLDSAPDFLSQAASRNSEIRTYAAAGWPPLIDPNDVGPVIRTRNEDQKSGKHSIFVRDGETHGYETADVEVAMTQSLSSKRMAPTLVLFISAELMKQDIWMELLKAPTLMQSNELMA